MNDCHYITVMCNNPIETVNLKQNENEGLSLSVQHLTKVINSHIMRRMASDRKWTREQRKQLARASNNIYRQAIEIGRNLL